jgi:hypothetical protein
MVRIMAGAVITFVTGGAVSGQDMYGSYPVIGVNQSNDMGAGRLIPTTAVEQYAGTLARWFGLSDGQVRQGRCLTSATLAAILTSASWDNSSSLVLITTRRCNSFCMTRQEFPEISIATPRVKISHLTEMGIG